MSPSLMKNRARQLYPIYHFLCLLSIKDQWRRQDGRYEYSGASDSHLRLCQQQRLYKDEAKVLREDLRLKNPHKQHRFVDESLNLTSRSRINCIFEGSRRSMDPSVHHHTRKEDRCMDLRVTSKLTSSIALVEFLSAKHCRCWRPELSGQPRLRCNQWCQGFGIRFNFFTLEF